MFCYYFESESETESSSSSNELFLPKHIRIERQATDVIDQQDNKINNFLYQISKGNNMKYPNPVLFFPFYITLTCIIFILFLFLFCFYFVLFLFCFDFYFGCIVF